MSSTRFQDVKPYFSLLLIVGTLFISVFTKMEVRRMGYVVLKATREFKSLRDHNRSLNLQLVERTTSARVQKIAFRQLTLNHAKTGQIIQLTGQPGQRLAIPQ